MGEIDDEYDEEEAGIEQLSENVYRIDGAVDLDDINEKLGLNLDSDNIETIGGFLIDILGEIPEDDPEASEDGSHDPDRPETRGDGSPVSRPPVSYENYTFQIESVKERRIEKLVLTIQTTDEADTSPDSTI